MSAPSTDVALIAAGGGYLCDPCREALTSEHAVCRDGCARPLDHTGTCDPRERDDNVCQLCARTGRLRWVDADALTEPAVTGIVLVRVENTYRCGRESDAAHWVPGPVPGQDVDDWLDSDPIHDLTGDGHPCGAREHALYEVTILAAPGYHPELRGAHTQWEG